MNHEPLTCFMKLNASRSLGQFDDLPAEKFGCLKPLPKGYAVVWSPESEMYYGTKRGTDLAVGETWCRYATRQALLSYATES